MVFSENKNILKGLLIFVSLIIVSLILYNTYTFFQYFKEEERNKMIIYSEAQKKISSSGLDEELTLSISIISKNTTIPVIIIDKNEKILNSINVEKNILVSKSDTLKIINKLKSENSPIVMQNDKDNFSKLYYGNSKLLKTLKYYPILLLIIILLFILLILNYYKTNKISDQNMLWAGMAKETAHQIATPLSSLIGWVELLKLENINPDYFFEIEKDINRLQNITDRFSKIGSTPSLEKVDIIFSTIQTFNYLKKRYEGKVIFEIETPNAIIYTQINEVLHSWTIENLIKNAIDAMKGFGKINLKITSNEQKINIFISDTGKGILKKDFKKIFETGFTTKKRGWGLGLSLTKRIVETYHKGKIQVLNSQIDKGTTFLIELKKL
jgi:two-component system, sporulation sensor kinase D